MPSRGEEFAGWWRIDRVTGSTLGVSVNGMRAVVNKSVQDNNKACLISAIVARCLVTLPLIVLTVKYSRLPRRLVSIEANAFSAQQRVASGWTSTSAAPLRRRGLSKPAPDRRLAAFGPTVRAHWNKRSPAPQEWMSMVSSSFNSDAVCESRSRH